MPRRVGALLEAEAIAEDLDAIGASHISDWLTDALESEDLEAFAIEFRRAIICGRGMTAHDLRQEIESEPGDFPQRANGDEGTIVLTGRNRAIYTSSGGLEVPLRPWREGADPTPAACF